MILQEEKEFKASSFSLTVPSIAIAFPEALQLQVTVQIHKLHSY